MAGTGIPMMWRCRWCEESVFFGHGQGMKPQAIIGEDGEGGVWLCALVLDKAAAGGGAVEENQQCVIMVV